MKIELSDAREELSNQMKRVWFKKGRYCEWRSELTYDRNLSLDGILEEAKFFEIKSLEKAVKEIWREIFQHALQHGNFIQ